MNKKNNDIIDKFINFIKKEVTPPIKKDLKWLSKALNEDLQKLTKEKKNQKKNNTSKK
tara:strand:+ start:186 stop:359 length:174 start_codon:yes stop_codon:yes gene_type:complete